MAAHSSDSHGHHIIPLATYFKVFGALIVLTVLTVGVATPVTGVSFGALNAVIAFAIATVKAGLVFAIFMHLKYDNMMNRVIIFSSFFFLVILWFFCILDEATRILQQWTL